MNGMDIVILCILAWGAWKGWQSGLLRQSFSLVGFFLGLWLASRLYQSFGCMLAPHLGSFRGIAMLLAFLLIWIGVPMGLSIVAEILTRLFHIVKLGWLNSLTGACLGLLKYGLVLSCFFNILSFTDIIETSSCQGSVLYTPLKAPAAFVFQGCRKRISEHLHCASDFKPIPNSRYSGA